MGPTQSCATATEQMAQMFGQRQLHHARDVQTKAFIKMKGFKGDEKAWPDWRYKFRVEASTCFRQAAAILDCVDRYTSHVIFLMQFTPHN